MQIELDIWDTAGNDRFKDLAPMYYRGSHGALVVYDITDASSLEKAKFWIRELNQKVKWKKENTLLNESNISFLAE